MVFPCRTYDDRATMEIYEVCSEMYDCEIYDYEMYKCEINVYEIYVYEIRDNLDIGIIYIYKWVILKILDFFDKKLYI